VCKTDGCEKSYCDARSLRRHRENHHGGASGTNGVSSKASSQSRAAGKIAAGKLNGDSWSPTVTTTATLVAIPSELIPTTPVVAGPTLMTASAACPVVPHGVTLVKSTNGDESDSDRIIRSTSICGVSEANANGVAAGGTATATVGGQLIVNAKGLSVQQVHLIEQLFQDSKTFTSLNVRNSGATKEADTEDGQNGERPAECTICGRKFKNVPALNGHMRLHGGYYRKDAFGRKVLNTGDIASKAQESLRKRKVDGEGSVDDESTMPKQSVHADLPQPNTSQLLADLERKGIQATSLAADIKVAAALTPTSITVGGGGPRRTHSCSSIPLLSLAQAPPNASSSSVSVVCVPVQPPCHHGADKLDSDDGEETSPPSPASPLDDESRAYLRQGSARRPRVGDKFQVQVQAQVQEEDADGEDSEPGDEERDVLVWHPETAEKMETGTLQVYLRLITNSQLTGGAPMSEEKALAALQRTEGHALNALANLVNSSSSRKAWTAAEADAFVKSLERHNGDVTLASQSVEGRSSAECLEFYKLWRNSHSSQGFGVGVQQRNNGHM
jgi:hypothetical protein